MAKYDFEDLLLDVKAIMTSGLNAKITAIEAEKTAKSQGLDPVLATVDSGSYYAQTWSDKILQTNPSIFYGVEEVNVVDGGGAVAKTYKVFCDVVLVDNAMTNDVWKRIARYSRALEELFCENFAPAIAGGRVKVEQVRPISWKLNLDSGDEIKVGGVLLTITLV